jgi:hypothetical protein
MDLLIDWQTMKVNIQWKVHYFSIALGIVLVVSLLAYLKGE